MNSAKLVSAFSSALWSALCFPALASAVSVTSTPVTETDEESAGERKAETLEAETAATMSNRALAEFTFACRQYLPKMTETDRQKAIQLVTDLVNPKAEAA